MMIYADVSSLIPCAGVNSPELIGQLVEVLPHIPMDVDYPYSCSPGLLGSSGGSSTALCNGLVRPESDAQPLLTALSSAAHSLACVCACVLLAWQCPAGYFCGERTLHPEVCPMGHFCPSGTSLPRPCPAGSWSSAYGLASAAECTACPAGSACATGSVAPTACVPGTFTGITGQRECSPCNSGEYQNANGQTGCMACTRGSYCNERSATPIPCPGGTYNNQTGRSSVGECLEVSVGFWAPLGSAVPEPCPPSGFYCPGAAADTVNSSPGSKPIIQATGGSTTVAQVEVVTKEVALEMSMEDYRAHRDAMRIALARQYGVDPSQISLKAVSGSLRLSIEISMPPPPPPAPGVTTPAPSSITSILSRVQAVDDSTLGSSLGTALNVTINVTTTAAPVTAVVSQTVSFVCPKGKWCTAGLVVDCPVNTYNNLTGQEFATACQQCPDFSTTAGMLGATSSTDCVCMAGFYTQTLDGNVYTAGDCVRCPAHGTLCSMPGLNMAELTVSPGWWRISNTSVDVRRCADADREQSGCTGGPEAGACHPSLTGPFCVLCANGDGHYYDKDVSECFECTFASRACAPMRRRGSGAAPRA